MLILILISFLTIVISANCSLYEAVLYSTRLGTLEAAKKRKDSRAERAATLIGLKKNISMPIAAILITNTLANTAGATIAGMYALKVLNPTVLPIFSILFTIGILFFSEIMPKNIGAMHWRTLWPWVVKPISIMKVVLAPAIYITEKFSQLFIRGYKSTTITEDEILAMIHLGAREGEITQEESRMVRSMIDLENKTARQVMTPRKVICMKDVNSSLDEILNYDKEKLFTRIPIWENEHDNIIGYVNIQDMIDDIRNPPPQFELRTYLRPIATIIDDTNCLRLLTDFIKHRRHIAIVVDEYDSVAGVITLEDLVETLIDVEIVDELDKTADLQKVARQRKSKIDHADTADSNNRNATVGEGSADRATPSE